MRWKGKRGRWRGEVGLFAAPKLVKPRSCVECKREGGRLSRGEEKLEGRESERERRRRRRVCVGVLAGRESACQKNLPLTEGMIHSRERERNSRDKERESGDRAEMPVKKNKRGC